MDGYHLSLFFHTLQQQLNCFKRGDIYENRSQCLSFGGEITKYNLAATTAVRRVLDFLRGMVIPVCPEVTGGLPVPRVPVELKGGRAINKTARM